MRTRFFYDGRQQEVSADVKSVAVSENGMVRLGTVSENGMISIVAYEREAVVVEHPEGVQLTMFVGTEDPERVQLTMLVVPMMDLGDCGC